MFYSFQYLVVEIQLIELFFYISAILVFIH
jgi:hypothetical protein